MNLILFVNFAVIMTYFVVSYIIENMSKTLLSPKTILSLYEIFPIFYMDTKELCLEGLG